jgi:hypothetical protein
MSDEQPPRILWEEAREFGEAPLDAVDAHEMSG